MPNEHEIQLLVEVGRRLRKARDARGLNLHELARLSGISAPALSLIETGKRDPRLTTVSKIAAALRLPLFSFVEGSFVEGRVVEGSVREGSGREKTALSRNDTDADGDGYDLGEYR